MTNQLKISSIILPLSDQSKSQILNLVLLLVGEQQFNGGNFKLVGHVTSLKHCKNSTSQSHQPVYLTKKITGLD